MTTGPYRPKFGFDIRIKPETKRAKVAKPEPKRCQAKDCLRAAETSVPKTRQNMEERIWLCPEHLRQHNAAWNYFEGMSDDEIRRHSIEAQTGHRPTWPLGKRGSAERNGTAKTASQRKAYSYRYEDGLAVFDDEPQPKVAPKRRLSKAQMDALNSLMLQESATLPEVKARYKELVKRYHPDLNGGDRGAEERLKQVIKAYGYLKTTGFA